jgi:hypothetical protein
MKQSKETSDMSDNDTKTGGVVVPLYTLSAGGRDSPRQLHGTLLTFVDKQYFAGTGMSKTEILAGARFVVMEVAVGWKRWEDKRVAEFATETNGRYPLRCELGHTDKRAWAPGFGGKPSDPWQDSREVVLLREVDLAEFTFCTATGGGRAAVDALRRSMQNASLLRPNQYPVIELAWRMMTTDYGMKSKPDLRIVGWWPPEATTIAPTDNDLNDQVPDLSK